MGVSCAEYRPSQTSVLRMSPSSCASSALAMPEAAPWAAKVPTSSSSGTSRSVRMGRVPTHCTMATASSRGSEGHEVERRSTRAFRRAKGGPEPPPPVEGGAEEDEEEAGALGRDSVLREPPPPAAGRREGSAGFGTGNTADAEGAIEAKEGAAAIAAGREAATRGARPPSITAAPPPPPSPLCRDNLRASASRRFASFCSASESAGAAFERGGIAAETDDAAE